MGGDSVQTGGFLQACCAAEAQREGGAGVGGSLETRAVEERFSEGSCCQTHDGQLFTNHETENIETSFTLWSEQVGANGGGGG